MVSGFITDTLVVIVVLGVMIFIHELGHFLAAKAFGVQVLTFSLGFGKRLFGFVRGGTDYCVRVLPFGGYVKMAGDDPSEVHGGEPGEFLSRPRWQRFVIVIMGPTMNVLLALVVLAGLYRFHYQKPAYEEQPVKIGAVDANSPAAKAGLKVDDLVTRFDGIENPKWEDVELKVITDVGQKVQLGVKRGDRQFDTSITPKAEGVDRIGDAGWHPIIPAVIAEVDSGSPASKAGLKPGDEIVAVNGHSMLYFQSIINAIQASKGKPVDLTIRRGSSDFDVHTAPVYSKVPGGDMWRIGVTVRNQAYIVRELPWGLAIENSLNDNFRSVLVTFDVLGKILTKRMSPRSLSGPIGIAQISGEAYRNGFTDLLMVMAFISLQLGIFNLLPIPILDGGVILLLLIEALMRRDLSLRFKERFIQVGIVFLLILAVFVVYNDIMKTLRIS